MPGTGRTSHRLRTRPASDRWWPIPAPRRHRSGAHRVRLPATQDSFRPGSRDRRGSASRPEAKDERGRAQQHDRQQRHEAHGNDGSAFGVVAEEDVREVAEDIGEGAHQDGEATGNSPSKPQATDRTAPGSRGTYAAGLGRVDSSNSPVQRSAGPSSVDGFRPRRRADLPVLDVVLVDQPAVGIDQSVGLHPRSGPMRSVTVTTRATSPAAIEVRTSPLTAKPHAAHTGCVEPGGHGTRHGRERIAPRQQRAHPDGHRQRSSAIMCR